MADDPRSDPGFRRSPGDDPAFARAAPPKATRVSPARAIATVVLVGVALVALLVALFSGGGDADAPERPPVNPSSVPPLDLSPPPLPPPRPEPPPPRPPPVVMEEIATPGLPPTASPTPPPDFRTYGPTAPPQPAGPTAREKAAEDALTAPIRPPAATHSSYPSAPRAGRGAADVPEPPAPPDFDRLLGAATAVAARQQAAGLGGDAAPPPATSPSPVARALPPELLNAGELSFDPATTLPAGTELLATLDWRLETTLDGPARATITNPAYSTAGRLLIPAGTRLIGSYSQPAGVEETRLEIAWDLLVFPDGRTFTLPALGTLDGAGTAGVTGNVNRHLGRATVYALLYSAISAGFRYAEEPATVGVGGSFNDPELRARSAAQRPLEELASATLRNRAGLTPTVIVPQGTPVRVVLRAPLQFGA